jgi:uncharacterized protein with HEPN domain
MMLQPDEVRLGHMLEAAEIRLLEVLGEAAKNVSAELRASLPGIAWREIAGARDRLIHGYFDVDSEVVWSIVTQDLPELVRQLRDALSPDLTH